MPIIGDPFPVLETKRLILRAFSLDDAPRVQQLVNCVEIARNTSHIPYPYTLRMARAWIEGQAVARQNGSDIVWALVQRESALVIGAMGLQLELEHDQGILGYWIGTAYWNRGYCTEAGRAVLNYAFRQLGLHRVGAEHFHWNPASGRVMQKLHMRYEGRRRQCSIKKGNEYADLICYGILRDEYLEAERKRLVG